jgi:vacuolar-type H+-ATPase subunit H
MLHICFKDGGRLVTDGRLRGRVKGLFSGAADSEVPEQAYATPAQPDSDAERQALQVLVLARRTADEHIAVAQQEAERIRSEAHTRAEEIGKLAQANAESTRREADKVLKDARARVDQMAREAQAHAEAARRDAEKVLADARSMAEEIVKGAQVDADELDREAQQRYQNVIGPLDGQRDALQHKIEALQQFERDHRGRLVAFMQGQLRALGVEVHIARTAEGQRAEQVEDDLTPAMSDQA